MTDKQIIDGVDVSGCEYYFNEQCRCLMNCQNFKDGGVYKELFSRRTETSSEECRLNDNCYYKQLKRKEQEYKELERQYKNLQEDLLNCTACKATETLRKQLDKLNAEKEKLKQECNLLKQALKNKNIVAIVEENEELKKNIVKQCPICGESFLTPLGAELYEENKNLKAENETLKEKLVISSNSDKSTLRMIKALDEIEEYLKNQLDGFGNAVYSVDKSAIKKISDIINKAKDD